MQIETTKIQILTCTDVLPCSFFRIFVVIVLFIYFFFFYHMISFNKVLFYKLNFYGVQPRYNVIVDDT